MVVIVEEGHLQQEVIEAKFVVTYKMADLEALLKTILNNLQLALSHVECCVHVGEGWSDNVHHPPTLVATELHILNPEVRFVLREVLQFLRGLHLL